MIQKIKHILFHLLRCNLANASLEIAIMCSFIFPLLYYGVTAYGNYYIHVGKIIESNKNLADYISGGVVSSWELNVDLSGYGKNYDTSTALPNVISQYYNLYVLSSRISYNVSFDTIIFAAYINNNNLKICDSVTYYVASDPSKNTTAQTGKLPSKGPVLDAMTLSVRGPVWIVVTTYTIMGISRTVTSVRRPVLPTLMISRNNVTKICNANFTSF